MGAKKFFTLFLVFWIFCCELCKKRVSKKEAEIQQYRFTVRLEFVYPSLFIRSSWGEGGIGLGGA